MKFQFGIEGLKNVDRVLKDVAPNHAKNLMRTTVHAYAGRIAKLAKSLVVTDTGNLKKAIKTKREKSHPLRPRSSVVVSRGKSAKNDGYYWRFVEYGTRGKNGLPARPFIMPAAKQMEARKKDIIEEEFLKKLKSKIKRELKKGQK